MAQDDSYERVLLVKPTVYVYKVPPITSASRGFKASDWNLAQPDWTGRLRLISRGDQLFLRIEDSNTGDLYCQAPIAAYPGPQVQQVSDSRRYFVVKVVSDSGRSALIGIGFADGSDSFDLNVALQDHFTTVENASKNTPADLDCPKLDLSLKGGIRVNLNIGSSKQQHPNDATTSSTSGSKSTFQEDKTSKAAINALFSDPSKPFILPPPPSASSRRR